MIRRLRLTSFYDIYFCEGFDLPELLKRATTFYAILAQTSLVTSSTNSR